MNDFFSLDNLSILLQESKWREFKTGIQEDLAWLEVLLQRLIALGKKLSLCYDGIAETQYRGLLKFSGLVYLDFLKN